MTCQCESPAAQAALKAAIVCITQLELISRKVDGDAATLAGVPIMPHIATISSLLAPEMCGCGIETPCCDEFMQSNNPELRLCTNTILAGKYFCAHLRACHHPKEPSL